jgi:hypothetical protein
MLMKKLFLVLVAISLSGLAQSSPPPSPKAAVAHGRPLRLEGMDYVPARRIILSYGWQPVTGQCSGVSDSDCASFPEIDACSCCGEGPCGMDFRRGGWCLSVGTIGGQPEVGRQDSDTHVTSVHFRRGNCSTPR